ncbi:thiol-disulfide oxidoreductase DCC family protein [Roseibacillus persicicus]|uniref:thiol-disulfide oxidoreductase DCC family protein n=1 Tax=Roseibacillus persicicus TaxID=454148 RepID=UPI00280DC039|nr:DCC1-like thiol-disulfide oxidoreductase family protein [Roseibacillus persicicus]MDQ8189526.1 DCC1-like thiol-disulfide oxidoreductase family protein [Roseibacillus persicicus]
MDSGKNVVFFDGGCLLCSGVVQWCHRMDRHERIWFAALDSSFAAKHRSELGLPDPGEGAETFAFWNQEKGEVFFRSDGAIQMLRELGGIWAGVGVLMSWMPRFLRDACYNFIARNRRRWWGTSEECTLPPASLRGKVLE